MTGSNHSLYRLFVPPVKVAAERTVEAAACEEVLAVRRAFACRVSRWSWDAPPTSGPRSGLRARRLDPRSLEVCDIREEGPRRSGGDLTSCLTSIIEVRISRNHFLWFGELFKRDGGRQLWG